jgi:hypothetical protein
MNFGVLIFWTLSILAGVLIVILVNYSHKKYWCDENRL